MVADPLFSSQVGSLITKLLATKLEVRPTMISIKSSQLLLVSEMVI